MKRNPTDMDAGEIREMFSPMLPGLDPFQLKSFPFHDYTDAGGAKYWHASTMAAYVIILMKGIGFPVAGYSSLVEDLLRMEEEGAR